MEGSRKGLLPKVTGTGCNNPVSYIDCFKKLIRHLGHLIAEPFGIFIIDRR